MKAKTTQKNYVNCHLNKIYIMEKILELTKETGKTYAHVNEFISGSNLHILDLMFPNHDGKSDPEAVANVMLLRENLHSLCKACEMAVKQLTEDIELTETE